MSPINLPKYNPDNYLKATISEGMFIDANQFLWRVHLLLRNSDFSDRNWFSKIYVDLLMAIESDLKSIAMSLSPKAETPEQAYTKVRKEGHKIDNLYQIVQILSKGRLKLLTTKDKNELINKYLKLSVNNRYDLITTSGIMEDIKNHNFSESSVKSILQERSLFRLEEIANKLHQISRKAREKNPIVPISGLNLLDTEKRERQFRDNIRL